MKSRRIRLFIRENHRDSLYSVGFWDQKKTSDPDRDFRCFGTGLTEHGAIELAKKIVSEKPKQFFYG